MKIVLARRNQQGQVRRGQIDGPVMKNTHVATSHTWQVANMMEDWILSKHMWLVAIVLESSSRILDNTALVNNNLIVII